MQEYAAVSLEDLKNFPPAGFYEGENVTFIGEVSDDLKPFHVVVVKMMIQARLNPQEARYYEKVAFLAWVILTGEIHHGLFQQSNELPEVNVRWFINTKRFSEMQLAEDKNAPASHTARFQHYLDTFKHLMPEVRVRK